ncbi:MAG: hypothetical protein RR505_11255 [Raoultibacter sp.]
MNTSKPSPIAKKTTTAAACVLAALLFLTCLGGCTAPKTSEATANNTLGQAQDRAEQGSEDALANSMESADLVGTVVDFDSAGFTFRPTQGDDETAMKPLQDVGTDRTIAFAANVQTTNVTYDRNTRRSVESPATTSDIKIDSSLYVWLNDAGEAQKIILFHLA